MSDAAAPAASRRRLPGLATLAVCAGLLVIWELAARGLAISGLPTAGEALRALPGILGDPESLRDLGASLLRMAEGFAIALVVATPVGLTMGRSSIAAALLDPLMMGVYPVPKAALMPLIMLWLGVGDAAKLLVIVLGCSLPLIYHARQGARAVEQKMLWSAAAMGMGPVRRLLHIVLPAALPQILAGCRTAIVMALITMITSEMIARQQGAGNILFNSLDMAQYDVVYAMIVIIGVFGIVLDVAFEALSRRLTHWSEQAAELPAELG